MALILIFLTSGTTFVCPNDWNPASNFIDTLGGGGAGGGNTGALVKSPSGGGGGHSRKANVNLIPGNSYTYQVGAAGVAVSNGDGGDGGDTWFGNAVYGSAISAAKGGTGGKKTGLVAGTGGQASAGIGDTKFSGGNGVLNAAAAGSGGGGAAGPYGNGVTPTTATGGDADVPNGGAGGVAGTNGLPGSAGAEYDATHGSGGGGGAPTTSSNVQPGAGGLYGGGGAGVRTTSTATKGGEGAQGLIVLGYNQVVLNGDSAHTVPNFGAVSAGRVGRLGASTVTMGDMAATGAGKVVTHGAGATTMANFGATESGTLGYLRIYLESGTDFVVPDDWNSLNNFIDTLGGGAGGGGITSGGAGGAGGGAWSQIFNLVLTRGAHVTYQIGAPGAGGVGNTNGSPGTDTWFNGASLAASSVGSKGGLPGIGGSNGAGGLGGDKAAGVGTNKNSGGAGSAGITGTRSGSGGGAGGPNGDGVGGSTTAMLGGAGDAGFGGAGGGNNVAGSPGTEYDSTHGSGGGGGGKAVNGVGPAGGLYGGGGAGGAGTGGNGGAGMGGLIVVGYMPFAGRLGDSDVTMGAFTGVTTGKLGKRGASAVTMANFGATAAGIVSSARAGNSNLLIANFGATGAGKTGGPKGASAITLANFGATGAGKTGGPKGVSAVTMEGFSGQFMGGAYPLLHGASAITIAGFGRSSTGLVLVAPVNVILPADVMSLYLEPNWLDGYQVTTDFLTDIVTSRNGREQRRALRQTPRKVLEFSALKHDADSRRFNTKMRAWQGRRFIVPDHTEYFNAAMSSGAVTMVIDEVPAWVVPGATVFLKDDGSDVAETRFVLNVSGMTITYASSSAHAWPAYTNVYRGVLGRFQPTLETTWPTNSVATMKLTFNVEPGSEAPTIPAVAPQTYRDSEIFGMMPNWRTDISATLQANVEMLDVNHGVISYFEPQLFRTELWKGNFLGRDSNTIDVAKAFYNRMHGQRGSFYAPTWREDIVLAAPVSTWDFQILAEGRDIFDLLSDDLMTRDVALIDTNFGIHPYRVGEVSLSGENSLLTFTDLIPPGLDLLFVSWLTHWRLASDTMVLAYSARDVAEFDFSFQSVESDEPPAVVNPGGNSARTMGSFGATASGIVYGIGFGTSSRTMTSFGAMASGSVGVPLSTSGQPVGLMLALTKTIGGPSVITFTPPLTTNVQTFFAPVVVGGVPTAVITGSSASAMASFGATAAGSVVPLATGSSARTMALFGGSVTASSPSMQGEAIGLMLALTKTVILPALTTFTPPLTTNVQTFFAPVVTGGAAPTRTLTPALLTNVQNFFGPVLTGGTGAPAIQWGTGWHIVELPSTNDVATFDIMVNRNLRVLRIDAASADNTDATLIPRVTALFNVARPRNIKLLPILFTPFQWGDRTDNGKYPLGDDAALYAQGYARMKTFAEAFRTEPLLVGIEMANEVNLLMRDGAGSPLFGKGFNASEYTSAAMHDWAQVLKGMSDAVDWVNTTYGTNIRRVLNTTSTMFGFLDFMLAQGVKFEVLDYHMYEHSGWDFAHYWANAINPTTGAPITEFNLWTMFASYAPRKIIIGEINASEIYDFAYANVEGDAKTEAGFVSLHDILKQYVTQTIVPIEAICLYELFDEPLKGGPESRFGLMYDLTTSKVSMLLAAMRAGGSMTSGELAKLTSRSIQT